METRSSRARKGLAGVQRARFPGEGGGLAPRVAGLPVGSVWAPGRGPTLLLLGPARLGSGLIFLAVQSQVLAHCLNGPRCTTGGLLLHSSSYGEKMFAQTLWTPPQERLPQSRAIYQISKVSHL